MRRALLPGGVLPPDPKPQVNHEKTSNKLRLKDILQNTRTALFIIVKVMKNTRENEETASDQRILRSYDN